jgi:hypothetical protein
VCGSRVWCLVSGARRAIRRLQGAGDEGNATGEGGPLTFKLDHVPEPCEAHELAILAPSEVRHPLAALLQPLVEALCHDDAALLLLHRRPHAAVLDERVVAAINRLHLAAVVGVALRPKGHEAWRPGASDRHGVVRCARGTYPIALPAACTWCRQSHLPC